MHGLRLAVTGGLLAVLASHAAGDPAQAKTLFDEGRKLIEAADKLADATAKADKVAAACDKFAASLAADATLGTKLNLADCRIRQGKLVEAYGLLDEAAAEAARTHDREAFAKQQLAAVAGKLVRVTINVARPDPSMTITFAGRTLAFGEWTKVQVQLPGEVVVDAAAPGHVAVHRTTSGGAGGAVTIEIPVLEASVVETPPPPRVVDEPGHSKVPYGVMGAGGALVLTAAVLSIHAKLRWGTAHDAGDMAGVTSAQHEADAATICVSAGAVAVAVGVWLYLRDRKDRHVATTPSATVTSDSVGLAVIGSF